MVHSLDDFWHRKYAEDKSGRLVPVQAGGRGRPRRRARARGRPRDPYAAALVLAVRGRARAADPGLRGDLLVVARRRRRGWSCWSGSTAGRSSPRRRRSRGRTSRSTQGATASTRPPRGSPHTKLAMWLFLASECLLFGALITTYVLYRGEHRPAPTRPNLRHPATRRCRSFVLLAQLAHHGARAGRGAEAGLQPHAAVAGHDGDARA